MCDLIGTSMHLPDAHSTKDQVSAIVQAVLEGMNVIDTGACTI